MQKNLLIDSLKIMKELNLWNVGIDEYIDECFITICCAENFSTGYSLMERRAYTRLCNAVFTKLLPLQLLLMNFQKNYLRLKVLFRNILNVFNHNLIYLYLNMFEQHFFYT